MKRLIGATAAVAVGLCVWLVLAAASGGGRHAYLAGNGCSVADADRFAVARALGDDFGQVQARHAIAIWQVGADRGLPEQAMVIAIATAIQESGLRVLANPAVPDSYDFTHDGEGHDHDSVGLFQQRQSWGPTEVLMDPEGSAGLFYDKLVSIDGWEAMTVAQAAQAVQVSAFPDAYATHEDQARAAVEAITEGCVGEWVHPTPSAGIVSGWRTDARPSHNGVDLGAARGTPILAASAGEVVTVVCNAHTAAGRPYSCDVDGSPEILGCGWYVEIAHPEGLLTRYCHMVQRPEVSVGDAVAAGDVLGYVGSSGSSSGPHLHLEVHVRCEALIYRAEVNGCEPVDPAAFFAQKGVELDAA